MSSSAKLAVAREPHEQVRGLRLRRRVERRERLVERRSTDGIGGERARDRDALALPARRTGAGSALPRRAARPTSLEQRGRPPRRAPLGAPASASPSAICAPIVRRGLSDANGFWKTICIRACSRRRALCGASGVQRLARRAAPRPPSRGTSPTAALRERALAAARLADEPDDLPALDGDARARDGAHRRRAPRSR